MAHHLQQPLHRPVKTVAASHVQRTFQSFLNETIEKTGELKISKHAEKRMADRGITISNEMWEKIYTKVNEASHKGINDSIVVTKDAALIVNAKNEIVITVMDRHEAESQIFTNINGAILMD